MGIFKSKKERKAEELRDRELANETRANSRKVLELSDKMLELAENMLKTASEVREELHHGTSGHATPA